MADRLPPNARSCSNVQTIFDRLEDNHGIDRNLASDRLHDIKKKSGRKPNDNVVFDLTGNVYDPKTLEWIGRLTAGGKKK
jgi:hypothetical protein